jgi:CBS-domain-containing membrane protein
VTELHAADVMSRPVVTVRNATSLQKARNLLVDCGFAGIPVVDDEHRVIGIVSRGDVLRISNISDHGVSVGVQKLLDDSERRIAAALAQMVPGTRPVRLGAQLD